MTDLKVLLIDDDPTNNLINKELLQLIDENFQVETIESAEAAIHYIKQLGAPDLIFLDINMAGMSGYEFLQWTQTSAISTKIIVLTAAALDDEKIARLNKLGCVDIIIKPITTENIESILNVT